MFQPLNYERKIVGMDRNTSYPVHDCDSDYVRDYIADSSRISSIYWDADKGKFSETEDYCVSNY